MNSYQHTQSGTVIRATLGASLVMLGAMLLWFLQSGQSLPTTVVGIVLVLLALSLYLFSSLTVEVGALRITLRFGPGLIRTSFPLADVASWRVVRNPWYYGWGIHLTPAGWLFNVSGFEAVELTMNDGRQYRIGTDTPHELEEAIRRCKSA